jgi:hypothetical protein
MDTKALLITVLVFFGYLTHAPAQIVVDDEVVTDTIDLASATRKSTDKSAALAMVASLALPGLGHQYLGADSRALNYYTAEALFVLGAVYSRRYSNRLFADSRHFARSWSGSQSDASRDAPYWKHIGGFPDNEAYNRVMELNRTPEDKFIAESAAWQWPDESSRERYNSLREHATAWTVVSSSFLGAMVLNRIISFIDVRVASRYRAIERNARLHIQPTISPDQKAMAVQVSGSF